MTVTPEGKQERIGIVRDITDKLYMSGPVLEYRENQNAQV